MRSAPQEGAAGAPQPRHMTPCVCHCAACRAAGHGDGACVVLCAGLHALFDGKADVVDLVLRHMRHYYGACGWDTARFDAKISCVQYGPGVGDVIAAGADDGRIHFICAQTGEKILCPLTGHQSLVSSVHFSPDGKRLVSGSWDKTVMVWDPSTGEQLCQLRGHTDLVWSVCFSPDGTKIVSGSSDKTVLIWDAASGEQLCSLKVDSSVLSVAYSPDGTKLTAGLGYPSNSVVVFDTQTNEQICSLRGHDGEVMSVSWSPDGTRLASGSCDRTVRLWDASTGAPIGSPLRGHTDIVWSVCFSPDGAKIASGSEDRTVVVWDAASGEQLCSLRGHSAAVGSVCFSSDGKKLTSGSEDTTVRNWDPATRAGLS